MITKTTIVPRQPPPNFQAPIPESSPLRRLFIIVSVYLISLLKHLREVFTIPSDFLIHQPEPSLFDNYFTVMTKNVKNAQLNSPVG